MDWQSRVTLRRATFFAQSANTETPRATSEAAQAGRVLVTHDRKTMPTD
jgi:hypothetical protein